MKVLCNLDESVTLARFTIPSEELFILCWSCGLRFNSSAIANKGQGQKRMSPCTLLLYYFKAMLVLN